jgi:hypothetical protein
LGDKSMEASVFHVVDRALTDAAEFLRVIDSFLGSIYLATTPDLRLPSCGSIAPCTSATVASFAESNFASPLWCDLPARRFADISQTENASKRGIYFLTQVRCYFVGMRVYVTLPYFSPANPKSREYFGQVIRVDKIESEKRGVAIQFL